jgi:hypothetical protein
MNEIGQGLNFGGSMDFAPELRDGCFGTDHPNIYDTFTEDGTDNQISSSYADPSLALRSAPSTGNIWFSGARLCQRRQHARRICTIGLDAGLWITRTAL